MRRLLAILILCAPSFAATFHVTSSATLATALTSSVGGDIIMCAPATYTFPSNIVKSGSQVLIEPDAGAGGTQANVIFNSPTFGTMAQIKFMNVTMNGNSGGEDLATGSHDVTFYNVVFTGSTGINVHVGAGGPFNINFDGDPGNMDAVSPAFTSSFINVGKSFDDGRLEIICSSCSTTTSSGITIKNTLFEGSGFSSPNDCADGINIDYGVRGVTIGPGNMFLNILEDGCVVHTDSIQPYPGTPAQGNTFMTITGNFFYNVSDAYLATDCPTPSNTITDNVFVMEAGSATAMVYVGGGKNDNISHNTFFSQNGANPLFGNPNNCTGGFAANETLTNNVLQGAYSLGAGQSASTFTIDYNLSVSPATGTHSILGNPTYVGGASPTTYTGFALTAGSLGHHAANDGLDMGVRFAAAGPSFTAVPGTVPSHHSGNITVALTAAGGLTWNGSTTFSVSGVAGTSLISKSNTSSTTENLVITTGTGTGTLTITDTTNSVSTTITVATASIILLPNSGAIGTSPTVTLNGSNTLWSSETPSTLFSLSGGFGASLTGISVSSNTSATATLHVGSAIGTETITDNSTTASATFTASPMAYVNGGCTQVNIKTETTSSSWTFSCAPQTTGDAVVHFVQCHPTAGNITAITLTSPGWTINQLVAPQTTGSNSWGAVFGGIAPSTASSTFTATFTGASNCTNFAIEQSAEFTGNNQTGGATTFNATGFNSGAASTCNQTAANITPPLNNEAVWVACLSGAITGASLPWTLGTDSGTGDVTEYQLLLNGAGVAQTPAFTGSSSAYIVEGVAIASSGSSQAATPTFSPSAATFTVGQLVTPSTTSAGTFICATIDNTTPNSDGVTCTAGFLFTTALSIGSTTTVKALAAGSGYTNSPVATATFTINSFNADNLYCPASGIPTWGNIDGPASLPQTCYNTSLANTPATGSVVNVSTSAQLVTALAAAACGQKITLLAGATFTTAGTFTVPSLVCPANNYLWIVSSGVSSLPSEGARYAVNYNGETLYAPQMSPCYSGVTSMPGRPGLFCPATPGTYTAKITTSAGNAAALSFSSPSSGIRIIGIEFTRGTGTGFVSQVIKTAPLSPTGLDHIIFDRIWCHGNNNTDETEGCFNWSGSSYMAAVDGYYSDFYCSSGTGHSGCDAHAIVGGLNTIGSPQESTEKIVNNWLEGAAETVLVGGGTSTTVPTDWEVRSNVMFKPLYWNPSDPSYNGGFPPNGDSLVVKNLFEFKNGQGALIEGNFMLNVWAQGQNGTAFLLTVKNQTGGLCPICAVRNITARYNRISTSAAAYQLVPTVATDGGLPAGESNISLHDNVADNQMYATCYQCGSPIPGVFQISSTPLITLTSQIYQNVKINHNTNVLASTAANPVASVWLGGPKLGSGLINANLILANNIFLGGSSGTFNVAGGANSGVNCSFGQTGGTPMLQACWSPLNFNGNCILNSGAVSWPGSNVTSIATQSAAFVNFNNGVNGDYTVAAGACKASATDGTDPGANLTTLASSLIGNNPIPRQDVPATFFGLHWKIANFPPLVPSGAVRLWDSLTRWQLLEPANNSYSFANLDTNLQDAKTLGVDVLFTLSTTPNFTLGAGNISSDPTNATCNYNSTATGGCGVPTDIAISCTNVNGAHNCDGKTDGTNQTWRSFIYNMANHIAGLNTTTYQIPSFYEIWNEASQQGTSGAGTCAQIGGTSWEGTCAQMVRMYADANCILTGRGAGCSAGSMGVPAVGIFPSAIVTSPSSVMTAPESNWYGSYLQISGATTNMDVAAVHAYTQGGSCCAQPETVVTRYATALAKTSAAAFTGPIWSTEGGWGQATSEPDVDLQAAFVARYYLLGWNAGFQRLYWYSYDSLFGTLWNSGTGLTKAGVSYGQIYGWMVGSIISTPFTATGTVWSGVLTNATGDHLVMWDTAQTCSGGSATTANQTVASTWLTYQDMTTSSNPQVIPPTHVVPVGAKPIILQSNIITRSAPVNPILLGGN